MESGGWKGYCAGMELGEGRFMKIREKHPAAYSTVIAGSSYPDQPLSKGS